MNTLAFVNIFHRQNFAPYGMFKDVIGNVQNQFHYHITIATSTAIKLAIASYLTMKCEVISLYKYMQFIFVVSHYSCILNTIHISCIVHNTDNRTT